MASKINNFPNHIDVCHKFICKDFQKIYDKIIKLRDQGNEV